jgi:hypothetical protein
MTQGTGAYRRKSGSFSSSADWRFEEIAMFSLRLFRFRSPERNRETDNRRLALIQKTVRSALADAEAEAAGLRARITKARRSSIFLLEQVEESDSHPARDVELRNIEVSLLTAEGRLAELKDHIAVLRKIEDAASTHHRHRDSTTPPNEKEGRR